VTRRWRRRFVEDHRNVSGEILQLKETINMVDQLNSFTGEVTRVAQRWAPGGALAAGAGAGRRRYVEGP
jgi:hypothetical protein